MRMLNLAVRAVTWMALGYLWREHIADRERLRAAQLAAVSPAPLARPAPPPPAFALPAQVPPPEPIALPAIALPGHEVPEQIDATEEIVTVPAPSAAPVPFPHRHGRTARHVLAVIVAGAAMGALTVWMLSAVPNLP